MRKARTLVPIPSQIAAAIDQMAGPRRRTAFIVDLLEREIRRREQREALRQAAGCWKDSEHSELAEGADQWVRQMRQESTRRLKKILEPEQAD
jgi:hypothetical protein